MSDKPNRPLVPLRWGGAILDRLREVRDEGHNRLGLERYVRRLGGRAVTARFMQTQARVMYRAAARSVLLARGIPFRTPVTQDRELRDVPSYILFGRKA